MSLVKSLLVCAVFLFMEGHAIGQVQLRITSSDDEPIPGAQLTAISQSDSTQIIQRVADNQGIIRLEKTVGKFLVRITYFGYDPFVGTVDLMKLNHVILTQPQLLETMVVTAQREATSVENAVQKITIISSEQIQKSGANNLSDILSYQTGIRLSQDNVLGSSMDLGGISGQNVKILVDGVPVIGRQNGNVDLSQINLNNVERIEIVEGPLSVNYGTNALAGTVNIITKKKAKAGLGIAINPYYETLGNYNLSGGLHWSQKKHQLSVDGGRNYFDGWSDSDPFMAFPKETLADTFRVKTWKPKEQYFGGARYSYSNENWQMSVYGKYFDELIINRGMPSAPYYETAFDDYYHTQRMDVGFTNERTFKKTKLNGLFAYNDYNRTKTTYFTDLTTLDRVLAETNGAQDTSRFNQLTGRIIFSGNLGEKLNYQVGADLNYSNGWGSRIDNGHQDIGDYAGFLTLDWKILDSLTLKPGIRYAYNTTYNSPVIPSLNVLYRVGKLSFRGSVARGYRAPDLKELYLDFVDVNHHITGNPELQAEDSWNYTAFVNWIKLTKKNALLKFEYGAYYNDIANLITLGIVDNNAYTYINIGKYSTIGQQLAAMYRSNRLQIRVNTTYIGRYNPDSEFKNVERYSFSPEVGAQVGYTFIKDRLQGNVFYKFNGALQSFYVNESDAVVVSRQSSYSILDASVTASFFSEKQLTVTLGAKNLLNVKQVNVIGQSQGVHSGGSNFNAGRGISAFLSLKYQLTLKPTKNEK